MKKLLLGLALVVASCAGPSTGYQQSNIKDAVTIVVQRHDTYVELDAGLTPEQKASFEQQSHQVSNLLLYEVVPAAPLQLALPPVIARYEAYVSNDTRLTAPEQVRRLRTSQLLTQLLLANRPN